ncbi:O-methyltransferase [uncultured Capnocytophaga sp.]|uniref:O-methyltransferase n=1 Tax=uncultured Capnocytophaga sp. TaxID=159273 RepID=UPI00262A063C|nr:O-methyltransferase [uncultured Capnocytophaga sp.]
MNSSKRLNYETRPAKFTERKMLLSSFLRICNLYGGNYQYIGLGGVSFTDFKLFHKELHINEMYSLEGGDFSKEKLQINLPFSFIKIIKERSTIALNKLDLDKKTLVWLDYDDTLKLYMFEDLEILLRKMPVGSVYLMSCNKELKSDETGEEYTVEEFREIYGDLAPFELKAKDFSASEDYKTIRTMFSTFINKIMKERDEEIKFQQLYNFLYQENRGAKMYTFGGVITEEGRTIGSLNLSDFDFIKEFEDPYKIKIPNLTSKEIDLINRNISDEEALKELINKKIVTKSEINEHKQTYKYLPNFYDVRL